MGAIKTIHKTVYDGIDASSPARSQQGKTVLVTGAAGGIGFAITRAFAIANASHLILLGRDEARLTRAVQRLRQEVSAFKGEVSTYVADLGDPASLERVWPQALATVPKVDVLVLNAATVGPGQSILQYGWRQAWEQYEINVRGNLALVDVFQRQDAQDTPSTKKYLVHVTSDVMNHHEYAEGQRLYAGTKASWSCLLEHLAMDVPVDQVQIVDMHPGGVYTESVSKVLPKDCYDWDDETLPGNFAVWAATDEAAFLHGRYCWAGWDVDEMRKAFEGENKFANQQYLRVGVVGMED